MALGLQRNERSLAEVIKSGSGVWALCSDAGKSGGNPVHQTSEDPGVRMPKKLQKGRRKDYERVWRKKSFRDGLST